MESEKLKILDDYYVKLKVKSFMKLAKILSREKKRAVFFNYSALIFYESWGFNDDFIKNLIKKYGETYPYSLAFFPGDGSGRIEMSVEAGLGALVIKRLNQEKQRYFQLIKKRIRKTEEKVEFWTRNHPLESIKEIDLESSCKMMAELSGLLIDVMADLQVATTVDGHLKNIIEAIIFKEKIDITDEDLFLLTVSKRTSPIALHDTLVLDLASRLKRYKLVGKPYEVIIKDKHIRRLLKQCYLNGYFLYSGYGGIKLWRLEEEHRLIKENIKNIPQLQKRKKINEAGKERVRGVLRKYHFSRELRFWLEVSQYFSYLRDLRKTIQQKIFYCQAVYLERIGKIIKVSRRDLEYLRYDEIKSALLKNREKLKRVIKERHHGYLLIWTKKTGFLIWEGRRAVKAYRQYSLWLKKTDLKGQPLKELRGESTSPGKVRGLVKIVFNPSHLKNIPRDFILVTGMTHPDFVPLIKMAKAIVTELGGITCHAAIISRELGIPCITGTKIATKVFKDGDLVEVDATRGVVRIIKN